MASSNAASSVKTIFPNDPQGSGNRQLLLILGIGLLIRICISFFTALPWMHKDSNDYFDQANTILAGGYTNFFPNGYPFIIAGVKLLAGSQVENILMILNIVMSVTTIYFVFSIAKKVFGNLTIALLAALIITLFPSQVNYTRWLTTEVPTAFFLTGAYYFFVHRKNWLSGLFFGLAIVTRTEILPIMALLLIIELLYRKKLNFQMLFGTLLPVLMVGYYCYIKTGNFSISGHGRVNILTSVTASGGYLDWEYDDQHPEANTSGKAVQLYLTHFKSDPGGFISNRLMNFWEMWGYPSDAQGSRGTLTRLVIFAGNLFLLFFGITAWWKNRKKFDVSILIIPFVIISAVHIVLFAMQRYTYPVEPFMIILSAWSLYWFWKKLR